MVIIYNFSASHHKLVSKFYITVKRLCIYWFLYVSEVLLDDNFDKAFHVKVFSCSFINSVRDFPLFSRSLLFISIFSRSVQFIFICLVYLHFSRSELFLYFFQIFRVSFYFSWSEQDLSFFLDLYDLFLFLLICMPPWLS